MITTIKGNLLDATEKYIAHQCNSVSNQAGGLAYHIFQRFPYANIYAGRPYPYTAVGQNLPGHCVIKGDGIKERFVINMLAQYYPGKPISETSLLDSSIVREGYFNRCLVEIAHMKDIETIAFPMRIGCGMAGGNWTNYLRALTAFAIGAEKEQGTRVVIYDPTP